MARGPSWRLQFIDIDTSYSINTDAGTICAYTVIRAPSGNTEPMYFPAGNAEAIYATYGVGTADWPDVEQAVAVNNSYGIFISAPAGSSADYPSYFGGFYITSKGNFEFCQVTDKTAPNFLVGVSVGSEQTFDKEASAAKIDITMPANPTSQGSIIISNISESIINKLQKLDFKYWGNGNSAPAGYYAYYIDRSQSSGDIYAKIYITDSEGNINRDVVCGTVTQELGSSGMEYTITLGGSSATNTSVSYGVPFLDFASKEFGLSVLDSIMTNTAKGKWIKFTELDQLVIYKDKPVKLSSSSTGTGSKEYIYVNNKWVDSSTSTTEFTMPSAGKAYIFVEDTPVEKFKNIIINGNDGSFSYTYNGNTQTIGKGITGIGDRIREMLDIKSITHCYIVQNSPTEKVTSVVIDNIGYDQYKYNIEVPYIKVSDLDVSIVHDLVKTYGFVGNLIAAYKKDDNDNFDARVYSYNALNDILIDVTIEYASQIVKFVKSIDIKDIEADSTFWYVDSGTKVVMQSENAEYPYKLINDINYNTITLSCSQEIYPGSKTSGLYNQQGSLVEGGVDASGSDIYWPNVLPEDSLSFIQVVPVNGFDKFCDKNGCYKFEKITEGITVNIAGKRYLTKVVNDNIEMGVNGCSANDGAFIPAVKQGWQYMLSDNKIYDEAMVAFDCTGYEDLKPLLLSCRDTFRLTTFIAPKMITRAEFLNVKRISVTGRGRGMAQYVGEFEQKDPYTGKKFWMTPIGYVAWMLLRIIDYRLGGAAPMWENDSMGLGGQLPVNVLRARWPFKDADEKALDEKGLNPIIYSNTAGVMITSQRTTIDPSQSTDWSYLGHSLAFDLCKREIRDNVMRPQIGKLNNPHYQELRRTQTETILEKRTLGSNAIWAAAEVEVESVNTKLVKMKREFAIYVRVQVNILAEKVTLTFENVSQGTLVD